MTTEAKTTEVKTVYFANYGRENTDDVFRIVRRRAEELGIKKIVVASTTGDTAVKAIEALSGFNVVVISRTVGFKEPNLRDLTEENRKIIESKGVPIQIATHAFGGLSKAMKDKFQTYVIGDIVAHTLHLFGRGMKVVCEIAVMAADAGLVSTDEDIICVAGSGGGVDTAIVLKPTNTHTFFDMKIREILCKPHF